MSNEKLMQLGGALSGLGGTAAVAYWVYTLETEHQQSFWNLPGIAGLIVTIIGLLMLVIGFMGREGASQPAQNQNSGNVSRNYQAGGDINIGKVDEGAS